MSTQNQNKISWQSWEFKHYAKNLGWYIVLISISILVISFFIIVESDIFAAVCISIITILIIIFSRQLPQEINIELDTKGIKFGSLFYPYKQIKYFWVVYNDNHKTVNFQTSALLNNTLILELEQQDPDEVRDFLLAHVIEHPQTEETSAQRIMHKLKF